MTFQEVGIIVRKGGRQSMPCPRPDCSAVRKKKKDPCLTVNNEEGNEWWKCNHCGWKGTLKNTERFKGVLENSGKPSGEVEQWPTRIINFFAKKGIRPSTLKKMGAYHTVRYGSKLFIAFPFYWEYTMVNVKFRPMDTGADNKRFTQVPQKEGAVPCFLGMQMLKLDKKKGRTEKNTLTIVEGETDLATYIQSEIPNVLSVPMGAPDIKATNFEKEFEYLKDEYFVAQVLPHIDEFILSVDNDEPGKLLKEELAKRLGKHRCKFIKYPDGYKDANEIAYGDEGKELKALGEDELQKLHKHAEPFPVHGIISISDVGEELEDILKTGWQKGLLTGNNKFDKLFSLKRKLMLVMTGIPGHGKTTLFRYYLRKLIMNNPGEDLKFALFTPEQRPPAREYGKIIEGFTGKSLDKDSPFAITRDEYEYAKEWVKNHFFIINPSRINFENFGNKNLNATKANTLESIMGYVKFLKQEHGIFGWTVDAWNKLEHQQPAYVQPDQFLSQQLDMIHEFNDVYDLAVGIIAHPVKMEKHGFSNNFKVPSLYNIKGGSAWNEKVDIGLSTYREFMQDSGMGEGKKLDYFYDKFAPSQLICEKMRFEEIGEVGSQWMRLDMSSGGHEYKGINIKDYRMKGPERYAALQAAESVESMHEAETQLELGQGNDQEEDDLPF